LNLGSSARRRWKRTRRRLAGLGGYRPVLSDALQVLRRRGQLTYAQEGEDRILARIFAETEKGFYVDVGAHHPIRFSNTYLLYRRGWRGIAIDPIRSSADVHRRIRRRDIALEVAIGREAGSRPYYEFDEPALNTLSTERKTWLLDNTRYRLLQTREVPVEPLATVLRRNVPAGQVVDLLCIDTEGSDAEVLASNDWEAYRPRIVVAEVLDAQDLDQLEDEEVVIALRNLDYRPVAMTENSIFFADVRSAISP
jgi:FkbM family methyltransferase